MLKFTTLAALAALVTATTVADAGAWTRNTATSGWRGTATTTASGDCYNGTCTRSVVRTGPYGNSASASSSTTCGDGACSRDAHRSGPRGATVDRSTTINR